MDGHERRQTPDPEPAEAREARLAAGRDALSWQRILAKSGANVVGEALAGQGSFLEWNHYPKGDVFDPDSASQWYYHAHPKRERPGEHGHFHTFRREGGRTLHLIAVAMDKYGHAIQLFTTNRWVTGEDWAAADEAARLLAGFDIALARPSWPTNRWLTSLLAFYRPTIAALLRERDAAIAGRRKAAPAEQVFEDRTLEVVSSATIDLARDVARIEAGAPRAGR